MVQIVIKFDGKQLVLPVNPEKITPSRSATNTDINLIGIGPATRKGYPGLFTFTIESFFPGPNSYYYKGDTPAICIDFLNTIWHTENIQNKVPEIIVTDIPIPIDMYFVIESFDYDHAAGQEDDIPFVLSIKQYKPYGAIVMTEQELNMYFPTVERVQSPEIAMGGTPVDGAQYTYTVESGDCLYNIAKACGNANAWGELYELNKDVIGSNPRLIKPGQQLKIPEGWTIPTNVAKLKNNVKKTNNNTTQLTTTLNTTEAAIKGATIGGTQDYDSLYKVDKTETIKGDKAGVYYTKDIGGGVAEIVDFDAKPAGDTIIPDAQKTSVTKQIVIPYKKVNDTHGAGREF